MERHLYTIVCDFRGGTYCSQVRAENEVAAVRFWAAKVAQERPVSRASGYISKAALRELDILEGPPVALEGLMNAWCFSASVGGDLALCNIVLTAEFAN